MLRQFGLWPRVASILHADEHYYYQEIVPVKERERDFSVVEMTSDVPTKILNVLNGSNIILQLNPFRHISRTRHRMMHQHRTHKIFLSVAFQIFLYR